MDVVLAIPDDLAHRLGTEGGGDLARQALEAFAVEAYRADRITTAELRRLLGFATRFEVDDFLKGRGVFEGAYGMEDYEEDMRTLDRLGL